VDGRQAQARQVCCYGALVNATGLARLNG
jgi:hypothetical protein